MDIFLQEALFFILNLKQNYLSYIFTCKKEKKLKIQQLVQFTY